MKSLIKRYWNLKFFGFFKFTIILIRVVFLSIFEKFSSYFWKFNLGKSGTNLTIQKGTTIRFPGNVILKDNVSIGRFVEIFSEFSDSFLEVGENTEINKGVQLDFSGNLIIGDNVVISEHAVIMSHDHGFNPHSDPKKRAKHIAENVWIGQNSIILPQAQNIGKNSIVAAGAVVTRDVPPNSIVAGNPAKIIKEI